MLISIMMQSEVLDIFEIFVLRFSVFNCLSRYVIAHDTVRL